MNELKQFYNNPSTVRYKITPKLGQALGIYRAGENSGFIGSVVGAIVVLAVLRILFGRKNKFFLI